MYLFLRLCKLQWGGKHSALSTSGLKGYGFAAREEPKQEGRWEWAKRRLLKSKRDGEMDRSLGLITPGPIFWPPATTKDMEKCFLHVEQEMVEDLEYWERGNDELNSIDALAFFLDTLPALTSKEMEPKQTVAILLKVGEGLEFGMILVVKLSKSARNKTWFVEERSSTTTHRSLLQLLAWHDAACAQQMVPQKYGKEHLLRNSNYKRTSSSVKKTEIT